LVYLRLVEQRPLTPFPRGERHGRRIASIRNVGLMSRIGEIDRPDKFLVSG